MKRSSQYRGVSFDRKKGLWKAVIGINYRIRVIGWFETEIAAAKAYNFAAIRTMGKTAKLNPIPEEQP